jgi:hypothetical protein
MDQTQERGKAGRGNDGLLESLERTVRLFFPPFPQTLEIDAADFHITTATATTGMNISKRCRWQALRFAPSGASLRPMPATTTKERRETSSNNYRELWLSVTGKIS